MDRQRLLLAGATPLLGFWWRIVQGAVRLWLERNAFSYAGSLAFYTLFSLAPTMLIAVAVVSLVMNEDTAQREIFAQLQGVMGHDTAFAIEQAMASARIDESGVLPTALGIGILLIGATTVFAQMQISLNTIWGVATNPGSNSTLVFMRNRLLSLIVVFAIGGILLASLILGVLMRAVLHLADVVIPLPGSVLTLADNLASFLLMTALFAAIFKILPDVILRWRDVLIGALVTALLFSAGRSAIALYLTYTATASTYGAAGSIVVILLWVYYSSLMLLFGAAFTRCHLEAKGAHVALRKSAVYVERSLVKPPFTGDETGNEAGNEERNRRV